MSTSQLQQEFAYQIAALIGYAYSRGYALTFGDAFRDPRAFGEFGVKPKGSYAEAHSVHKVRLAIDLNLFVDGKYVTDKNNPAYQELGSFWKQQHELARWGGDFHKGDANHFSFEYQGYK
jgi:hypothetical protein